MHDAQTVSMWHRVHNNPHWLIFAGIGLLCLLITGCWGNSSDEKLLKAASTALAKKQPMEAERLVTQYLQDHPDSSQALLIAGRAAWSLNRHQQAFAYLEQVNRDNQSLFLKAQRLTVEYALELGIATVAERSLRLILEDVPSDYKANDKLITLLRFAGRNWEVPPYLRQLIRTGHFKTDYLLPAGSSESIWIFPADMPLVERSAAANDLLILTGLAREQIAENQYSTAQKVLQTIVAEDPDQIEAQAWLGFTLLESGSRPAFQQWHRNLPQAAEAHPQIWYVRGMWARQEQDTEGAARSFWETLQRNPHHMGANYRLSQALVSLDRAVEAELFAQHAKRLADLKYLVAAIPKDPEKVRPVAEIMESLGRHWEAIGWCQVALADTSGNNEWARQILARLEKTTDKKTPMTLATANPAQKINLSSLSVPDLAKAGSDQSAGTTGLSDVSFTNSATAVGLDFSYFNGADPTIGRAYMFEFSGGGAAILDYDGDGWSDLYLTQGCAWPPDPAQQKYRNRLFRNLGNGRFQDVTEQAGLGDNGFGQGVTVGDINNDGFADLYVANIGANRLYQNNGDGTFTDVTATSGLAGAHWTISCLLADLNGDSWPDLYDVNYLTGDDLFTRACTWEGKPTQCSPIDFPAAQDQVYLNRGNGTFQEVTKEAGIVVPNGKGMGVVAADFDGSRRLSLFVANDMTANFFFTNQTSQPGGKLVFKDRAVLGGLGFNDEGHADSCMGIAAGDVNRDGLLDLFVTNFRDEANNFFLQRKGQLFDDVARQSRLREFGFLYEGWGTQFIDGELDGWPDLVVSNGHLEITDPSCRMPTQYFANLGNSQFANLPAAGLGSYFQQVALGRSLALVDWNRDGKEDFLVTHVDSPTALLTNQTKQHGHFLAVQLRGVTSSRDAIGTTVRVTAGGQTWTRQLKAGDGFQASNQRQLIFGLGAADQVESLTISWPAGSDQTFENLAADHEFLFIEGNSQANKIPR